MKTITSVLLIASGWAAASLAAQPEPAPAPERPAAAQDADATAEATPPARNEEPPLEAADGAPPLLDYEPTETISEDSSVSFPIDI